MIKGYHAKDVLEYANSVIDGKKIANKEIKQSCKRFLKDLKNPDYEFRSSDPDIVIDIIENLFVHEQGEALDGTPLPDKPFILEQWQKFIVYNLLGFYHKGTNLRRYNESFIMVPRKNGKTPFMSAFGFAMGMLERASGSKIYIVAATVRDAMQSFNFLKYNVNHWDDTGFRVLDNNQAHSIQKKFVDGSIYVEALVARDSIVGNVNILDELHQYKTAQTYLRMKKAQKAYSNKLTIGITTAGDSMNSFGYEHMRYCQKVLDGQVKDEQMFVFIAKADEGPGGYVDYTDPKVHEMANPNYGVTIRPQDILADSLQAQNNPQNRKEFLAKDLNVYTSSVRSYFDLNEFIYSDEKFDWGYEKPIVIGANEQVNYKELAKLPIKWYGGADLSIMYDLTAAALYGEYKYKGKDIGILITHAFYPITRATAMADELNVPYFGWQDNGWLTFSNNDVIEYEEVIKWFIDMRDEHGLNIIEVGYDRQYSAEFVFGMEEHGFKTRDVRQAYWNKSRGFREIERRVKQKQLYYLHSEAFEYCVENVKAMEDAEERVRFQKTSDNEKIDLFDAGVMAVVTNLDAKIEEKEKPDVISWFG